MAHLGSTIRLFISSTFTDFQRERQVLQRRVFPRLRQVCADDGFRFLPVDLRWGVSAAASAERQTLRICFDELERCQTHSPDFYLLILLGDRYGTCFLPQRIPVPLLTRLRPHLTASDLQAFEPANSTAAYALDQNAIPPDYVLRPRPEIGEADEASLRRALAQAAMAASCSEDEVLPFVSSATHQEIHQGLLAPTGHANGVLAAFRTFAPEPTGREASHFQEQDAEEDAEQRRGLLVRLKYDIENKLPKKQVLRYNVTWGAHGPQNSPADDDLLAHQFLDFLEPRIRHALAERQAAQRERDAATFATAMWAAERREHVVGRADEIERLIEYVAGADPLPFVLTGAPGSGKSTLMAEVAAQLGTLNPQAVLVTRYVGVTPGTSSLLDLLTSLNREINERFDQPVPLPPADVGQLATMVAHDLRNAKATAARPLILLVDALDQLGTQRHATTWLPHELAPYVRVIVSVPLDQAELADLQRWIPQDHVLVLGPLNEEAGRDALRYWVGATSDADRLAQRTRRTLTEEQVRHILAAFAEEGRPLYLRLAAEEAKRWRSFDAPPALPSTLRGLLATMLTRLEQPGQHGRFLVHHALGNLAAARNGLAEDELLDVLARDDAVRQEAHALNPGAPPIDSSLPLPVVLWARLAADVAPLLSEREADGASLLTFYHRQFGELVTDHYLDSDEGLARHSDLASYFGNQPLFLGAAATVSANRRQLSELPYQQAQGALWSTWEATLTDARFLEQKIAYQGTGALLEDMQMRPDDPIIAPLARVISAGAVVLNHKPDEIVNQVTMRWWDGPSPLHDTQAARVPAFHLLFPSRAFNLDQIRIFEGFVSGINSGGINGCAFSPDGRLALGACGGSGNHANALRLWDITTGQLLLSCEGHSGEVLACAFSPDGRILLSSSDDGTLRLWDAVTGKTLQEMREHRNWVRCCAYSSDGMLVLSGSDDMTLRLWDVATGKCVGLFEGHSAWVNGCAFSPDGRTIVSGAGDWTRDSDGHFTHDDNTLRLWDVKTGRLLKVLRGHREPVIVCIFRPGGKQVLSASLDSTLRLWDIASGRCLREFRGHETNVTACTFSPDGQMILSGSLDRTLKLWEVETGRCVRTLRGHSDIVNGCAFSPDGQTALSASGDGTLRLWDVHLRTPEAGGARRTAQSFEGHADHVQCCAFSRDGRCLVTGSRDGNLQIWNAATGRRIHTFAGFESVNGCNFSPDGNKIVSAADHGQLRLWDTATGERLGDLTGHTDDVAACSFSPDGTRVVSASVDGTVRVWDAVTGSCLLVLEHEKSAVNDCAWSPDGQVIVSVSSNGKLWLWDMETGSLVGTRDLIPENRIDWNFPRTCAFSVDGQSIIIALDKTVQLVSTHREVGIFRGHTDDVAACAFSPDGQFLLSASHDRTVRLWSVSTEEEIAQWLDDDWVRCCAFSPDGVHASAGDDSGSVHFFEVAGLTISAGDTTKSPQSNEAPSPEIPSGLTSGEGRHRSRLRSRFWPFRR